MEPSMPHSDAVALGFGAGYLSDWWKIDIGYMFSAYDREKDNQVGEEDIDRNPNGLANGTYSSTLHILALSFTIML
jgi:long-subunit fatty acid transport protein